MLTFKICPLEVLSEPQFARGQITAGVVLANRCGRAEVDSDVRGKHFSLRPRDPPKLKRLPKRGQSIINYAPCTG